MCPPGNFLYLCPRDGAERTAYDLRVADHHETDPNYYYTMSRAGITHFRVNAESEFTPLDQWEREYFLFHRIRRVPFFLQYRSWKAFTVWRLRVSKSRAHRAGASLRANLFLFNPALNDALLRLRRLCYDASKWPLLQLAGDGGQPLPSMTLDQFTELQARVKQTTSAWLRDLTSKALTLVRGACDLVLDSFLAENGISGDRPMSFMERAAMRSQCVKLCNFVQLADFIVRAAARSDATAACVSRRLAGIRPLLS